MDFNGIQDFLDEMGTENIQLDAADESAIFLEALQDACTPEEWQIIQENMHELELYGLIESAEIATEAKKIVYKQTKQMNLNREESKAALRIAEKANTADWKEYSKARKKMLAARDRIYAKHKTLAKSEAKRIVNGGKKKASSMKGNTVTGDIITNKIGAKSKQYNS